MGMNHTFFTLVTYLQDIQLSTKESVFYCCTHLTVVQVFQCSSLVILDGVIFKCVCQLIYPLIILDLQKSTRMAPHLSSHCLRHKYHPLYTSWLSKNTPMTYGHRHLIDFTPKQMLNTARRQRIENVNYSYWLS